MKASSYSQNTESKGSLRGITLNIELSQKKKKKNNNSCKIWNYIEIIYRTSHKNEITGVNTLNKPKKIIEQEERSINK